LSLVSYNLKLRKSKEELMADTTQVKINSELHERVREHVNSESSTYDSLKSFYEQAVREHLKRNSEGLSQEELDEVRRLIEKFESTD